MSTDKANPHESKIAYTKNDFVSDQDVRWCPGCGDYAILAVMQRTLSKFSIPREKYVFISGIGCSSRFPYYMNNYGFHTVHGRAPAIASGLQCVNPDLVTWVITGDGDALSIGGNHLIHAMRRNVNINIVLVNNRIYGLTKGQYSPTSEPGKVTKSSPMGSIDFPLNPMAVALSSEATFIARTVDTDPKHLGYTLERAMQHKGTSFVEIFQNCIIFNDKAFSPSTGRDSRDDRAVYLEHDKALIFGKKKNRGLRLKGLAPEVVEFTQGQEPEDLLIHNEAEANPAYVYLLSQLLYPEMPVPLGVFRALQRPTYDEQMELQLQHAINNKGKGDIEKLIYGDDTWTVN